MGLLKGLGALHTLAITGVLSGLCLAVGLGEVVTYFQNPEPVALPCAGAGQGAGEGWVVLSGCQLRVADAAHETWADPSVIRKLYVPLAALGTSGDVPLGLVMATEDEGLIGKYQELLAAGNKVTGLETSLELIKRDPEYARFTKKVPADLQLELLDAQARLHELARAPDLSPARDVQGMLQGQDWLNEKTMGDLQRELGPRLAPGFRLLEDGASPRLAWPLTLTVLGVLFGLAFLGALIGAVARSR
jgi:hypothetical protein